MAVAVMLGAVAPAAAQVTPPGADAPLDPESPMDPLPGLGVDWPEMGQNGLPSDAAQPSANETEVGEKRYTVEVDGLDPALREKIMPRFDLLSTLKADAGKPANAAQIDRRAREDADLVEGLLKAEGYYEANVDAQVEAGAEDRLLVRLAAEAGPLFRFSEVELSGLDPATPAEAELRKEFAVGANDPVNADAVIADRARLDDRLKGSGYPFAKVGEPEVVVDHDTQSAVLALKVEPGGLRRFGQVRLSGSKPPFDARHVQRIARYRVGAPYRQADVEDLKRALVATGLVSSASVEPVPAADGEAADIAVELEPAPPRTIAAELGYGTGEGIRIDGSWTHRNFLRPEGAVTFRGVLGTREQFLGAILRQSNFGRRDNVLNARAALSHINRAAFEARSFTIAAGLERQSTIIWQKKWTWSGGVELVTSDERDVVGAGVRRQRTYYVGAVPLTLNYDGSDSLLDPRRGFRLGARISPELSLQSGTFGYVRAQLDGSAYLPAGKKLVLAGRIRLGTIAGANSDALAPSRRFYAGGGGSVRGYGFQEIGPRDIANDPDGGRSLAEFSLEARVRIGNFGVVPFIDGGNIYRAQYPDFSGIRYGAGIGLRYYSNFGPIRIDVGTPINPRKGDAPVTVFVSLGQSF
jgi:translocation and assembly module TamA